MDIIYAATAYFVKVSLPLLFRQIFRVNVVKSRALRAIQFGFVFASLLAISHLIVSIMRVVQCSGLAAVTLNICKNHTVQMTNIYYGSFNVATDLYILAIPLALIRPLQMSWRRNLAATTVFLAGFVACGMSVCRIVNVRREFGGNDQLYTAATISQFRSVMSLSSTRAGHN